MNKKSNPPSFWIFSYLWYEESKNVKKKFVALGPSSLFARCFLPQCEIAGIKLMKQNFFFSLIFLQEHLKWGVHTKNLGMKVIHCWDIAIWRLVKYEAFCTWKTSNGCHGHIGALIKVLFAPNTIPWDVLWLLLAKLK